MSKLDLDKVRILGELHFRAVRKDTPFWYRATVLQSLDGKYWLYGEGGKFSVFFWQDTHQIDAKELKQLRNIVRYRPSAGVFLDTMPEE